MTRSLETEHFFEGIASFYEQGKRWVRDERLTNLIVEWMAVWEGCQLLSIGMGTGKVEAAPFLTGLEFIAFMRRVSNLEVLIAFGIDVGSFVGRDYLDPLGVSGEIRERVLKVYRQEYYSTAKRNLREQMHLKLWGNDVFLCQHFMGYIAEKNVSEV